MRKQLFEYAVLLHPEVGDDGKEKGDTQVIVDPTTILASNEKTASLLIARSIPEEHVDALDRIQIIIRSF